MAPGGSGCHPVVTCWHIVAPKRPPCVTCWQLVALNGTAVSPHVPLVAPVALNDPPVSPGGSGFPPVSPLVPLVSRGGTLSPQCHLDAPRCRPVSPSAAPGRLREFPRQSLPHSQSKRSSALCPRPLPPIQLCACAATRGWSRVANGPISAGGVGGDLRHFRLGGGAAARRCSIT